MTFLIDVQELKNGLIIFRRSDVAHKNWYCRVRVPESSRYKTVSLKTPHIEEAKDKAFDHDADIRFRVKHAVPIFEKTFAEVAMEYSVHLKKLAESGQITMERWRIVNGYIRLHLIPFLGNEQIITVGENQWKEYPFWRKHNNAPKKDDNAYGKRKKKADGKAVPDEEQKEEIHQPAKDGTIRQEMKTFRAVMNFAADKQYIRERQVPKGKLPTDKGRREEFTPQEYRHLHKYAREEWIADDGQTASTIWYRKMTYNFMLILANTGMRTMEARNLRWRDMDIRKDNQGRDFIALNVRGKGKYRELVAAGNVVEYLDRVKKLSHATKPDDFIFTMESGVSAGEDLYGAHMESLMTGSGLLFSSSGSRRSTYSFRHTYATFRLMEGVDVYFLAKQMGTSVKMIEDYYGHITPAKNAERILQGIAGWEPIAEISGEKAASVNAGADGKKRKKTREKPRVD